MNRTIKQIAIALIYFLLIGGVIFLYFALRQPPAPSCSDGIKNQEEEGIDCGGPCKSCEQIKPLTRYEVEYFPTRQGFVDVFAEVRNSNISYGVPQLRYTFEIYDKENVLIGSRSGVSFMLPNSTKFVVEQAIPVQKTPAKALFTITKSDFQEIRDYIRPRLSILGDRTRPLREDEGGFLAYEGTVANQGNVDFDTVYITVRLMDDRGQTVAVNQHEVNTLRGNTNRFFDTKWVYRVPYYVKAEPQVDTNIFENSNYLDFLEQEANRRP